MDSGFKVFGREPTLYITLICSAVLFIGTLGLGWISGDQAGAIVAVISALSLAAAAALTRPVAPAAFSAALSAIIALAAAYGFHATPEQVAGLNALVVPALGLIFRGQVSPAETPLTRA